MSYRAWMSETQRRHAVLRLLFEDDRANARAAAHEALARRAQKQRELDDAKRAA